MKANIFKMDELSVVRVPVAGGLAEPVEAIAVLGTGHPVRVVFEPGMPGDRVTGKFNFGEPRRAGGNGL